MRVSVHELTMALRRFKAERIAAGKKTWVSAEYFNGYTHLYEVDADSEKRHCTLRHVTSGTKHECLAWLQAASF